MIPRVAASESGGAQTGRRPGVVGPRGRHPRGKRNGIGRPAIEGESPVRESPEGPGGTLSTAGHEESCRKRPGPSGKAKYHIATDSERVPRGKGEKNPGRGVKENLKPRACEKSEPVEG